MSSVKHSFSMENNAEFFSTLRTRVNEYFQKRGKSRFGNVGITIKSIVMFSVFLAPLVLLLCGVFSSSFLVFVMYCVMGLGSAGIGLNIMHDANHGVLSKKRKINIWLGYSMELIGSNNSVWKIQHNVLHHTYTNIEHADEDIDTIPMLLRFSPHQKRRWIHRYQHIYAWFLYGLMTIMRTFVSDFVKLFEYRRDGYIKTKSEFRKELMVLFGSKLFYFTYILVLPIVLLPVSPWVVVLSFLAMHYITGIILAVIFQTAHVMPTVEFPLPDEKGKIETSWAAHELATTTNFAPKNKVLTWFIGGLNYQVEHHLFANICHVHYSEISGIVKETALEFGLPYNSEKSFWGAIKKHAQMLKMLGRQDQP